MNRLTTLVMGLAAAGGLAWATLQAMTPEAETDTRGIPAIMTGRPWPERHIDGTDQALVRTPDGRFYMPDGREYRAGVDGPVIPQP